MKTILVIAAIATFSACGTPGVVTRTATPEGMTQRAYEAQLTGDPDLFVVERGKYAAMSRDAPGGEGE